MLTIQLSTVAQKHTLSLLGKCQSKVGADCGFSHPALTGGDHNDLTLAHNNSYTYSVPNLTSISYHISRIFVKWVVHNNAKILVDICNILCYNTKNVIFLTRYL